MLQLYDINLQKQCMSQSKSFKTCHNNARNASNLQFTGIFDISIPLTIKMP